MVRAWKNGMAMSRAVLRRLAGPLQNLEVGRGSSGLGELLLLSQVEL